MISLKKLLKEKSLSEGYDQRFEQKFKEWFKKNKNSESLKKEYEDHKKQRPNDKRSISNFAREYFYLTFYW